MIGLAAVAGGVSPLCSCGVIPLIAALLAMGVPLSAVMAFWLTPVMDPSKFVLTTVVLGADFAVAKTLSAIGLGIMGGTVVYMLNRSGALTSPSNPASAMAAARRPACATQSLFNGAAGTTQTAARNSHAKPCAPPCFWGNGWFWPFCWKA